MDTQKMHRNLLTAALLLACMPLAQAAEGADAGPQQAGASTPQQAQSLAEPQMAAQTVSYTHLDVYKRQTEQRQCMKCLNYYITQIEKILIKNLTIMHFSTPVSYTHLDVYKRQHLLREKK